MSSPVRKQTRLPRAQRHAQLLDAAHSVFSSRGYHVASMDHIAEAAGVSKPVLYQHFPGKRELYLDLLDAELERLLHRLTLAVRTPDDNAERVGASIRTYFDFVAQDAASHRFIFSSDLANDAEVAGRLSAFQDAVGSQFGAVIEAQAGLSPQSALLLGHALAGAAQTAASHWVASEDPDVETAATLVTRLAWRGIGGFPQA